MASMNEIKKNQIKPESQFQSLLFNIIIPVLLLNKGSAYLGTKGALMIALAFPITYGLYDWFQRRKTNFISLLGLLNVALTGGLALSGLGGGWFAVKEAAFPALIGLFVLGSAFSARPFIKTMFLNEQFVYVDLIQAKVQEAQKEEEMQRLIKNSTILLSLSFALSAGRRWCFATPAPTWTSCLCRAIAGQRV